MHLPRPWYLAAQRAEWFQLTRHDDPDPDPAPDPPEPDPAPDPDPDPEGADKLGDKGKAALDRMKADRAAAKKEAADAKKDAAALAKKVAEFEDRDKTELDKATAAAERASAKAKKATDRATLAEVKAAAAGADFADPSDAALLGDLSKYVSDDGDIDTEAIEADLADLLERKPHLRKSAAAPEGDGRKPAPKPDPGQGPRPPTPAANFATADRAEVDAELARLGHRRRS